MKTYHDKEKEFERVLRIIIRTALFVAAGLLLMNLLSCSRHVQPLTPRPTEAGHGVDTLIDRATGEVFIVPSRN